jgi:hypothetical protein
MKKRFAFIVGLIFAVLLAVALAACGEDGVNSYIPSTGTTGTVNAPPTTTTGEYTKADTNTDLSADGNVINLDAVSGDYTITVPGDYLFTGTLIGSIIVNVGDEDKVQLILGGVNITNTKYSPIYIANADKTTLTIKDGTLNTLIDGATYSGLIDGEPSATIFSHDDLSINGTGTLNVTAKYLDGIVSKDDLKIIDATINVTAKDDGIRGRDSVTIKDAVLNITAGGTGIKTTNNTDTAKGNLIIDSGTITISATNDGIHSENALTINGGTINVTKSYEGIEGLYVTINNGTINITATDDGINGAGGTDSPYSGGSKALITINGGTINISAATSGQGDSIDSNGSIVINGGIIKIVTPKSARDYEPLDCDVTLTMTGGSVYVDSTLYTASTISSLSKSGGGGLAHGGNISGGGSRR